MIPNDYLDALNRNSVYPFQKKLFWTPGLLEGVLSNRPCPSVCWSMVFRWSVFKYLRDRSLVFSNFLHEVRAP